MPPEEEPAQGGAGGRSGETVGGGHGRRETLLRVHGCGEEDADRGHEGCPEPLVKKTRAAMNNNFFQVLFSLRLV